MACKLFISLALLLKFAVFSHAACPSPGADGVVEYIGDNLKMSDVVACSSTNQGKKVISIMSFNSTEIDVSYPNYRNVRDQPSILLITPNLIVPSAKSFDLHGEDGAPPSQKPSGKGTTKGSPGQSGGSAGSILIAYNSVTGEGSHSMTFTLNGGNGGNGQDGQDAIDGENGDHRPFKEHDESYCNAWAGGWVRVRLTPNRCHEQMDGDGRCKADDSGARIDVYGFEGTAGSHGNAGGAAGKAGSLGISVVADISTGRNSTTSGTSGTAGQNGVGGSGGKGGKKGDTNALRIDDAAGASGKWCKELSQSYVTVNEFADDGNNGQNGGNCCASEPPATMTAKDFAPYIQTYVNKCNKEASDKDNFALFKFCTAVLDHFRMN